MTGKIADPVVTLILLAVVGLPMTAIASGFLIAHGEALGWFRFLVVAGLLGVYFGGLGAAVQLLRRP